MALDIEKHLTPPAMLVIFLLIVSLIFIFPVLNMVVLGAILAYGVRPIAHRIQSKLKYNTISIFIAILIVLIPLILLIAYIAFEFIGIITVILASNTYADVNSSLTALVAYIPLNLDVASLSTTISSSIQEIGTYIINYFVKFLSSVMNIILDLFILICSIFYFVRDGSEFMEFVKSFVPNESKHFFDTTIEAVKDVLRSIFYGHFLTSVIIGIFAVIGYSLLGYPYGIFLGVITGILQLIPVFGPWPIYWILFFADVLSGNYPRAIVVLIFGFFLSSVDMYIRPALSSHYADIHPLILLIGFLSGPLVYGIVGFIVGPLILGITYAVLDNYRKEFILGDE